eukprot:4145455-Pyramimonas_sp.AAC.1
MAFACPGARVIFGKDTAAGVAVCAGPAQRGCNADDAQRLLRAIPERLRDELTAYLAPALSFDVLHVGALFDLRPLALTWPALEEALAAQPLLQNQGFPRFHGGDLNARLDALCRRPGVVVRRPPPPVRPDQRRLFSGKAPLACARRGSRSPSFRIGQPDSMQRGPQMRAQVHATVRTARIHHAMPRAVIGMQ